MPLKRLTAMLLAPVLVLALAAPSTAPAPQPEQAPAEAGVDGVINQCMNLRQSQPRQAMAMATTLIQRPGLDSLQRIKIHSCHGVAAALTGEPATALTQAEAIEAELAAAPSLPIGDQLRAHSQVGRILHVSGQIYEAIQAYERVVNLAVRSSGEDAALVQASTLNNIGLIHADYLDADEVAEGYFRQAIALYELNGEGGALTQYNLSRSLQRQGKSAEALEMLRWAAKSSADNEQLLALRIRSAISELDPEVKPADRLEQLSAISQAQAAASDPAGQSLTLARISSLKLQQGHDSQALALARRSLELSRPAGNPSDVIASLDAVIGAHTALGNTRLALQHADFKHAIKQENLRKQRLDMLAGLQARNQDAISQRELERLRYEEHIDALQAQKSQTLRSAAMITLLLLLLGSLSFALLQRRRRAHMQQLSERDYLTGLANRHAATAALNTLSAQRCQNDARHVLFLIDVDHFKQINDTHGHHAGDRVLAEVSQRLLATCRPGDLVSRWGGEEFLVACPNLTSLQAAAVATRLREAMAYVLQTSDGERQVTASLGLAPIPFFDAPDSHPSRRWDYALRMADRALYAAKERRNAWVGYWGSRLPEDEAAAEAVLECPEAALQVVEVMSSFPRDMARARKESLRALAGQH